METKVCLVVITDRKHEQKPETFRTIQSAHKFRSLCFVCLLVPFPSFLVRVLFKFTPLTAPLPPHHEPHRILPRSGGMYTKRFFTRKLYTLFHVLNTSQTVFSRALHLSPELKGQRSMDFVTRLWTGGVRKIIHVAFSPLIIHSLVQPRSYLLGTANNLDSKIPCTILQFSADRCCGWLRMLPEFYPLEKY